MRHNKLRAALCCGSSPPRRRPLPAAVLQTPLTGRLRPCCWRRRRVCARVSSRVVMERAQWEPCEVHAELGEQKRSDIWANFPTPPLASSVSRCQEAISGPSCSVSIRILMFILNWMLHNFHLKPKTKTSEQLSEVEFSPFRVTALDLSWPRGPRRAPRERWSDREHRIWTIEQVYLVSSCVVPVHFEDRHLWEETVLGQQQRTSLEKLVTVSLNPCSSLVIFASHMT